MSIITDSVRIISKTITDVYPAEMGFPYSRPDKSSYDASSTLFQATVTDAEMLESFMRNPLAKVIINDVVEDVFEKGFKIHCTEPGITDTEKIDEELTNLFVDYFKKFVLQPFLMVHKLSRLYGYSVLLIGFDDNRELSESAKPRAKITYFQPIDKTWIQEIEYKKDEDGHYMMPVKIESYKMQEEFVATESIHPSRVLHFENIGIDILKLGVSSLLACYDDLTVMKHVTWGAGQTMWRSGNQMVSVIGPPRATDAQVETIDNALVDINTQTAMAFPYGTIFEAHAPAGLNPAPYAKIPIDNIAAATRIPLSILIGTQKGALSSSLTDARDYASTLSAIQSNIITPLLNTLFWTLQKAKTLPYKKFEIVWENTLTMSKSEETTIDYKEALTADRLFELEQKKKAADDGELSQFPPTTIEQPLNQTPDYGPATETPVA